MNFYTLFLVLAILISAISFQKVYAEEPLPITISFDMENVVFDGKWTTALEWKRTSLETINFDENFIAKLRFGHQDEFVYMMLDVVSDKTLDMNSDRTIICFDTDNNKSKSFDESDFCFSTSLGKNPETFQGASNNELEQIQNPSEFLAAGGISDEIDIYSKEPHPVFEFRIPTETIGRHDFYGFFISYFDANTNQTFTWPSEIHLEGNEIPAPEMWGEMYSPDKSLPEFEFPLLLLATFLPIIILFKIKKRHIFEFNR